MIPRPEVFARKSPQVDEAFKDDLKRMYNDLEKPIVYDDLLSTEQARAQTLCGLLGGSVRNRALQIVKRVEKRDGFEAKGEVPSSQLSAWASRSKLRC